MVLEPSVATFISLGSPRRSKERRESPRMAIDERERDREFFSTSNRVSTYVIEEQEKPNETIAKLSRISWKRILTLFLLSAIVSKRILVRVLSLMAFQISRATPSPSLAFIIFTELHNRRNLARKRFMERLSIRGSIDFYWFRIHGNFVRRIESFIESWSLNR